LNAKAYGKHLLIRIPSKKKTETDGGIQLPDNFGQKFAYGRIVSMGDDVHGHGLMNGDCVLFDHLGARKLELDPVKDEGIFVVHESGIFGVIPETELVERKVPVPA
jgi:co-chaperonin GroES (HSP10)